MAVASPASRRSASARQSNGACAGTDITSPVPVPGSTNPAGSTGTFLPPAPHAAGTATRVPTRSAPFTAPFTSTFLPRNSSLRAHSGETTHSSPSTSALAYSAPGLTHRFVAPNSVSGRSVAAGRISPPSPANLTRVYSVKSGSTSPSVSCWETGFWSRGHHPTGCEPCTMRPLSRSAPTCHSTNLEYAGSIVVNSRRQSME